MSRISDRKAVAVFLATTLAILASCASPKPPAYVQESPADTCRKYQGPTQVARCHLFMSAEGWQFIPEIGWNADLDRQIRCAPVAPDLDIYADCLQRATASLAVATPVPAATEAAPVSRAPILVERIGPESSGDDFEQLLREVENLDAALRTTPRTERIAPATIARSIPNAPPVTVPGARPPSRPPIRLEQITPRVAVATQSPDPNAPRAKTQLVPGNQNVSIEPREPSADITKSPRVRLRQLALTPVSDDTIRQQLVQEAIAQYSGSCPCPYNVDRGGRRCGGRSAYSRPGGESPYCYASDVPAYAIEAYRERSMTQ
jgi:hypothetical protein